MHVVLLDDVQAKILDHRLLLNLHTPNPPLLYDPPYLLCRRGEEMHGVCVIDGHCKQVWALC